jgi:type I restriction enzyme S subunit
VNKIPLTTNQHCCNFQIDPEKANYRYVFHWVASHYEDIKSFGRGVRSDLSAGQLKQYPILLPPLQEQNKIASVLDKFDQLTRDSKIGLPAEIAARRQQYEYYQSKLLNFKKLEVA